MSAMMSTVVISMLVSHSGECLEPISRTFRESDYFNKSLDLVDAGMEFSREVHITWNEHLADIKLMTQQGYTGTLAMIDNGKQVRKVAF